MNSFCETLIQRGRWNEDITLQRCDPPIGPRNAWSNLAFAITGLIIGLVLKSWSGVVLAAACCYLCWSSWRYHYYKTVSDNQLDRSGMFAVYGGITAFAIGAPALIILFISVFVGWLAWRYPVKRDLTKDLAIVIWPSVLLLWVEGNRTLLIISLTLAALGFISWILDRKGNFPLKLWGHALWHKFMAASMLFVVLARN